MDCDSGGYIIKILYRRAHKAIVTTSVNSSPPLPHSSPSRASSSHLYTTVAQSAKTCRASWTWKPLTSSSLTGPSRSSEFTGVLGDPLLGLKLKQGWDNDTLSNVCRALSSNHPYNATTSVLKLIHKT